VTTIPSPHPLGYLSCYRGFSLVRLVLSIPIAGGLPVETPSILILVPSLVFSFPTTVLESWIVGNSFPFFLAFLALKGVANFCHSFSLFLFFPSYYRSLTIEKTNVLFSFGLTRVPPGAKISFFFTEPRSGLPDGVLFFVPFCLPVPSHVSQA